MEIQETFILSFVNVSYILNLTIVLFPSDKTKRMYMFSYLSGCARSLATTEWSRRMAICNSLLLLPETFKLIFQSTNPGRETPKGLISLKQGKRSVSDYAKEFLTTVADWMESSRTSRCLLKSLIREF